MMGHSVAVVFVVVVVALLVAAETHRPRRQADSTATWNKLVDVLLDHARVELAQRGRQELELNDVDRSIDKKFAFIKIRGNLKAEGGWLRDVTTAHRIGDVITSRVGSTLKITATVGWSELRLGYRHYRLEFWRDIEGELEASARSNAVRATFSFDNVDGACKTSMDEIRILELGDLEVKISGLGFLNFIAEHLVKWFVESRKGDLTSRLEEMFKEAIPEHLEDFECDEYASLLQVQL